MEPYLWAAPETRRSLSGLRPQSFQLLGKKGGSTTVHVLLSGTYELHHKPNAIFERAAESSVVQRGNIVNPETMSTGVNPTDGCGSPGSII